MEQQQVIKLTDEEKKQITKMAKQFAGGFKDIFGGINFTGWLIIDPLSGFLNAMGKENTLKKIPQTKENPMVLIIVFKDGSMFIPAGADLKPIHKGYKNWMWL